MRLCSAQILLLLECSCAYCVRRLYVHDGTTFKPTSPEITSAHFVTQYTLESTPSNVTQEGYMEKLSVSMEFHATFMVFLFHLLLASSRILLFVHPRAIRSSERPFRQIPY
ncbi:unnamed protein product [Nezara viridula]|uniref:Neuropeptide n=1 Tax=Nezara viridula TaxID=85310 RepID=A0A9P0HNM2_NEZVI|nr:unnamed protein product [Nezara viridula]